jgi:AcrR family transcriptional regulator
MPDGARRRRRPSPDVARQEILEAARAMLLSRPPREVTVRAIMNATGLARPSFYDHFDRRGALVIELVQPVMAANRAVIDAWPESPADPRAALADVTTALLAVWREHGALLAALAEAAQVDADAAAAYAQFSVDSIARVASKIEGELEAGSISGLDAAETATALVLMNRSYLMTRLLSPGPPSDDVLVRTLVEVWHRTLWPEAVSAR